MANNGLPCVLQHAHPVGQNLQHNIPISATAHRTSPEASCECSASLIAVTRHVHLVWFGFEFTLFSPDEPGSDQGDSALLGKALVRLAENQLHEFAHESGWAVDVKSDSPIVAPTALFERPIRPAPRPILHVAALPLCDTARHERSGVQLI
jgi:hypothetical protein